MPKTRTTLMLLSVWTVAATLLLASCQTLPQRDQVQYLLKHQQFQEAKRAAPAWSKEALTIINDLQKENQLLKAER